MDVPSQEVGSSNVMSLGRLSAVGFGAILLLSACSGDDDANAGTTTVDSLPDSTALPVTEPAVTTTEPAETTTTMVPPTTVDPLAPRCADDDGEDTVGEGARRGRGEARELCLGGEWVVDPELDTQTTVPTDDELASATIGSGTYVVEEELPLGLYRVAGSWMLLDERGAIVAEDAIDAGLPGYTLMSVGFGVPTAEIVGEAVQVEFVPVFDPLAESVTQGTYLVGIDLAPGTYRVTDPEGAYAARLGLGEAGEWDVLGEESGESVAITVQPADFALRFVGDLEPA